MKINSLIKKGTLIDDVGDEYVDLSQSSIKKNIEIGIKALYIVNEETEMRMDLISLKYYGSTKYIDILCKANNIFNPFSIEVGDILVIPSVDNDTDVYEKPKGNNNNGNGNATKDIREKFIDKARLSEKDKNRVDRLKEKSKGKKGTVEEILPSNMLQPGVESKTFIDGKIQLGANLNNR
jgi:hypothetical protein